jgi:hypothetical protein
VTLSSGGWGAKQVSVLTIDTFESSEGLSP